MSLPIAETRNMEKTIMDFYKPSNGSTIGRIRCSPGWCWSKHVKPIAGTELCNMTHIGYCINGKMVVHHADGTEYTLKKGDFYHIPAGHDAWVEGDETCELLDFLSADKIQDEWKKGGVEKEKSSSE